MLVDIERYNNDEDYAELCRIQRRKEDGILAYQTTQRDLRKARLANGIPDSVYTQYVYTPLDNLINKINGANWLEAYNIIDAIPTNPYLSSAILLNFKIQIANYIVGPGEYLEYSGKLVDELTGNIIV